MSLLEKLFQVLLQYPRRNAALVEIDEDNRNNAIISIMLFLTSHKLTYRIRRGPPVNLNQTTLTLTDANVQ